MVLKVGTSSGIYMAARAEELATAIKKLGYTLTKGVGCMEIAADVAHEVPYTDGVEIRHIARKQGVTLLFHGDLAVPMCIPERGDWREAHEKMTKSVRSAVWLGAKYIDFHACLNVWLEMITYTGRKLTMAFVDQDGNFISKILKENRKLREWFIREKGDIYMSDILNREGRTELSTRISVREDQWHKEETDRRIREGLKPYYDEPAEIVLRGGEIRTRPLREILDDIVEATILRGLSYKTRNPRIDTVIEKIFNDLRRDRVKMNARIQQEEVDRILEEKLSHSDPKKRRWYYEELRTIVGVLDGYHIMNHYLFYTKDPIWVAMAEQYRNLMDKYNLNYSDGMWLDEAWRRAEKDNDREFKEFYYAVGGAKFLEGHIKALLNWIDKTFIPNEIEKSKEIKSAGETEELRKVAKNLIIAIENPDARESQYAGLYFLWRPKQIYAAVKTIRKTLNTKRVMMIMDHEHLATQGRDALIESNKTIKTKPDFGSLTISVHSNHPNPLHPHEPIYLGDLVLYELLYNLRRTGLGRTRTAYLIFERGGGEDPYKQSIDNLKRMAFYLEKDVPPKQLPLEFYGMKGPTAGDVIRQGQIIRDHAWEPLKDLLDMPEEEWTFLSQTAVKKGKKPEAWKRGEFR